MAEHMQNEKQMIEKYSDTVYRLAFAMLQSKADADDIYQEVFLRYVRRKPHFNDTGHEKAWFLKVTSNCAKSLISSPFRNRTQPFNETKDLFSIDDHSLGLRELIKNLKPKYRRVLHLYYYEDINIAKIGRLLNIKETTIRSQLFRARQLLKKSLKGDEYEF